MVENEEEYSPEKAERIHKRANESSTERLERLKQEHVELKAQRQADKLEKKIRYEGKHPRVTHAREVARKTGEKVEGASRDILHNMKEEEPRVKQAGRTLARDIIRRIRGKQGYQRAPPENRTLFSPPRSFEEMLKSPESNTQVNMFTDKKTELDFFGGNKTELDFFGTNDNNKKKMRLL